MTVRIQISENDSIAHLKGLGNDRWFSCLLYCQRSLLLLNSMVSELLEKGFWDFREGIFGEGILEKRFWRRDFG